MKKQTLRIVPALLILFVSCGTNYYKLAEEKAEMGETVQAYVYYGKAVYDGKMDGSVLIGKLKSQRTVLGEEAFWQFVYDIQQGVGDEIDALRDEADLESGGAQRKLLEAADGFGYVENLYSALYDKQILEVGNVENLFNYGM